MRRTNALVRVAVALMADPSGQHWGYELSKASGLRSGVLYPILHRMHEEGWLEDGWEEQTDDSNRKRPPRRYYELTDSGREQLGNVARSAKPEQRTVLMRARRYAL